MTWVKLIHAKQNSNHKIKGSLLLVVLNIELLELIYEFWKAAIIYNLLVNN